MKEKLNKLLLKPWAAYTAASVTAVVLYMLLSHVTAIFSAVNQVLSFLSPVIIGIVVAYLFNPAAEYFEKKLLAKMKKESARQAAGVTLVLILLVSAVVLLLVALIPSLIKSVTAIVENWDYYTEKATVIYDKAVNLLKEKNIGIDLTNLKDYTDSFLDKALDFIKNNGKSVMNALGAVGTGVSNFGIGICFGFCFLYAKNTLLSVLNQFRCAVFKKEHIARNNELFQSFNRVFIRYSVSTLLDALIIGVATLLFALIMKMPYAPLIAVICAITNIIPTIGPMIGSLLSMFFLVLDKPSHALWFFIFSCVLQSLDGMVIKPRLMKGSLGIPASWSLILLFLGGKIAGMAGIILSIPFAAVVMILYHETVLPKLIGREKKINETDKPTAETPENIGEAE